MSGVESSKLSPSSSDNGTVDKIAKERKALAEEKQRFMSFFVESLKGQDPTAPTDHSQVINTMLSYQNTTNLMDIKGLLYDSFNENNETKLSSSSRHVGQGVIIKGNDIDLMESEEDGKKVLKAEMTYQLEDKAKNVKILIKDRNDVVIAEIENAAKNKGMNTFTWDGKLTKDGSDAEIAKLGKYTYEVVATDASGNNMKVVTYSGTKDTIDKVFLDYKGSPVFSSGDKQFYQDQIFGYQAGNDVGGNNLSNLKKYGIKDLAAESFTTHIKT
jgi:flagellar hook assembly protein FlgD